MLKSEKKSFNFLLHVGNGACFDQEKKEQCTTPSKQEVQTRIYSHFWYVRVAILKIQCHKSVDTNININLLFLFHFLLHVRNVCLNNFQQNYFKKSNKMEIKFASKLLTTCNHLLLPIAIHIQPKVEQLHCIESVY